MLHNLLIRSHATSFFGFVPIIKENMCSILSVVAIGLLNIQFCAGVIIVDSGNLAHSDTFVDVNHPEFFASSTDEKLDDRFPVQESVEKLNLSIMQNLANFNLAMVNAMKREVEKTDAASAVNLCKYSRARLTSMRMINNFQTHLVNTDLANVQEDSPSSVLDFSANFMNEAAEDFHQMIGDLQQYDEATNGKEAMTHFQNALKNFNSLQIVLASV